MKRTHTFQPRRMILAAMLACLAFVLSTFVYFPAMAPFSTLWM